MSMLQFDKPSFEFKISNTDLVIKKALNKFGDNCAVSWSGGKDSTLVLSRALKQKPNIKVLFENTLIEFPETIYFIRKYTKEWNLDLIETRPIDGWTFRKVLEEKGIPKARQTQTQGKNRVPFCCQVLKDEPAIRAIEQNGIEAVLTGMTTAESETRGYLHRYDKCSDEKDGIHYTSFYYFVKGWNVWKFNPIMNWKQQEVFDIHKRGNIPLCEVYTKWNCIYKRLGCLCCPCYLSYRRKLAKTHPRVFQWLQSYLKYKEKID